MRFNTSIIISFITLVLGMILGVISWIPVSVLVAGVVDLYTRRWVMSDKLGSAKNLSMSIKFFFALIGFYAMIGQLLCVGLIIWWFI